jgi:peptidoglycan/LPS O-acetylase OafA/YrhL
VAEEPARRIFGLDLVRAAAIALVLAGHGASLLPRDAPGRRFLFDLGGFFGVELFFVLSGFLIGAILLRTLDADGPLLPRLGTFWLRRWLRTLPNYYLFLALNAVLWGSVLDRRPFNPSSLFFLQNFSRPLPAHYMNEAWTLAVEEWFYVTIPLTLVAAAALPVRRRTAFLVGIVAYIAAFTVLRVVAVQKVGVDWTTGIRGIVIYRLDSIGYGVLLAFIAHVVPSRLQRAAGGLACVGALLVLASVWLSVRRLATGRLPVVEAAGVFTLTSLGLALTLPWLASVRSPGGWTQRIVRHVSETSYSMYLLHLSFVLPFTLWAVPQEHTVLRGVVYLALTVAGATAVFRWFERPLMNLRPGSALPRPIPSPVDPRTTA